MKKVIGILICLLTINVWAAADTTTRNIPQTSVNTAEAYKQIKTIDDIDMEYVQKLMLAEKFSEAANYMDYVVNSLDKKEYAAEISDIRIINALAKYKAGDMDGAKAEYDELYKVYGYSIGSFTSFITEMNTAYNFSVNPDAAETAAQNIAALSSSSTENAPEISRSDKDKLTKLTLNGNYKKLVTEIDKHLTKITKNNNLELYTTLIGMRAAAKYKLGDDKGAREDYQILKDIYGSMMNSYEQFVQAADYYLK